MVGLSFGKRQASLHDMTAAPDDHLHQLRALPFVKAVKVGVPAKDGAVPLTVTTPSGIVHLSAIEASGPLSYAAADHLVRRLRAMDPTGILFAREVSRNLGAHFEEQGVLFMDRQGNCNVVLGESYVARVEGRPVPHRTPRGQTSMRAPGYKVLFALLAEPDLVQAPLRTIAERAGASRQAASDTLARLVDAALVDRHKKSHRWIPHRKKNALERWLVGYADVLRPHLLLGSFRTPDRTLDAMEQSVARTLNSKPLTWRWGGCAAGYRLTQHYRGDRVVAHIQELTPELRRNLKALPDASGPLVLLQIPGPAALAGETGDTVHPLLVYAEMLAEGSERAREAASEVAERYLVELETQ
jgi:hypothetical protein